MKTAFARFISGLASAIRTLTILPVPGKQTADIASGKPWFPVVGALIGVMLALIGWLVFLATGGWNEAAAIAVLAAGAVLTRGLHLDGLSDWADGFWGGYTPQKRLSIMKDSCVGAFGAIALVIVLVAKWIALTRILAGGGWTWLVAAGVLSRTMQVALAYLQPYARSEGGTGHGFVTKSDGRRTGVSMLVAAALLALTVQGVVGLLVVVAGGVLITVLFGWWCRRAVGGVTGDLLGACSEFVELWALMCGGVMVS